MYSFCSTLKNLSGGANQVQQLNPIVFEGMVVLYNQLLIKTYGCVENLLGNETVAFKILMEVRKASSKVEYRP